jgi:uncharacterized coiled-coil DUF342 family protein
VSEPKKLTAEERVRAVTHDMFELLLVHNNDAIRIAEEHAAAAVAEVTREWDEARKEVDRLRERVRVRHREDQQWAAKHARAALGPQLCETEQKLANASAGREAARRERDEVRAEFIQLLKERDEARERITAIERKLSETYASRSALDCVYAGPYMEPDAGTKSHCPPDKPCQRCLLERERDGLVKASAGFIRAWEQAERERDDARAEVEWLRANNSDLRLRNAELVGQALAEHRAEIEAADGGEGER